MTAISTESIDIAYLDNPPGRVLLEGLDLELSAGDLLAVIGANGSGKSSLLRVLAGLQRPQNGRVKWRNTDLTEIPRRQRPRISAALFSNFARVPGLTVFDLVALGRQPYTGWMGRLAGDDVDIVAHSMESTGTTRLADEQVTRLSDGEYQKVLIAKLLAQDTPILILDEPTAHLDVPASIELLTLLKNLTSNLGKTVVFTSHDLSMVFQMVERVLLLGGDGNYALGTPQSISEHALMCGFLKTDKARFVNGRLVMDFAP